MESGLKETEINFGASAAAVILLFVLLGEMLDDLIYAAFLNSSWGDIVFSLQSKDESAIAAVKRSLGSTFGSVLTFGITVATLKAYFPRHSIRDLFIKFGLIPFSSPRTLFVSFLAGILLILIFRYVLLDIFPPPEYAAVHPANIINSGSTFDKLTFIFGVVVLAPIAEEFLFRGVLYYGISTSLNKPVAAMLVTVCFVLVHPEAISTGYWLTHALLYLTACLLMLIREIIGSLFAAILFHAAVNFASLLL